MKNKNLRVLRWGPVMLLISLISFSPLAAREGLESSVLATADHVLRTMPDDYYTIKSSAVNQEIARGAPFVLDVREPAEFAIDHIPGAKNVPIRQLTNQMDSLSENKNSLIIVYCKTGHRDAIALTMLRMLGYANVRNVYGGFDIWKAAGFEVAK